MDPILVITNAAAGTSDEATLEQALEVLREVTSVEVAATADPGELDGALTRAGSRRIVVAGGDGSLHTVIAALHRRNELSGRELGLLPMGTGNDFARSVGIPLSATEAATLIATGRPKPMDLLVDEVGSIVTNSVHAGVGAQAGKRGAAIKERLGSIGIGSLNLGRLGYPIGAALAALDPPSLRLHIEVDGQVVCDVDQQVLMVAVGNGRAVGGGTELTPDADPADGKADVMISLATSPLARAGYVVDLLRRRHPERDDVLTARGSSVSIRGDEFWCSADGEIYGPERSRTWQVQPAAYSMIVAP